MHVNNVFKLVVIYVVGKEVLDVNIHNSLDIVNAFYVGLILSGNSHSVVITKYCFVKDAPDVFVLCNVPLCCKHRNT